MSRERRRNAGLDKVDSVNGRNKRTCKKLDSLCNWDVRTGLLLSEDTHVAVVESAPQMNEELMEVFARDETCVSWGYLSLHTDNGYYGSSIIVVVAVGKGILLVWPFTVSRLISPCICQFEFVVVYSTNTNSYKKRYKWCRIQLAGLSKKISCPRAGSKIKIAKKNRLLRSVAAGLGVSRILWQQLGQCHEIDQLGLMVAHRTCR